MRGERETRPLPGRVVRRIFELCNQLDPDPETRNASREVEELLELFDPEIEFTQPAIQVDAGVFRGHEVFLGVWDEWLTLWEQHRSQITEIDEREDSVLVLNHNWFRGRDGIELEIDNQTIFTLSGGRVTQMRGFFDEAATRAAFEAAEGD